MRVSLRRTPWKALFYVDVAIDWATDRHRQAKLLDTLTWLYTGQLTDVGRPNCWQLTDVGRPNCWQLTDVGRPNCWQLTDVSRPNCLIR